MKIKNQWWLCDFTWGAGYVGSDKKFVWNYTEHYFLTDPEEFILDHFPIEPEWQLTSLNYTIEQFQSWAKFYKHFFIHQLRPLSHRQGVIETSNGEVEVVFETSTALQISCKLTRAAENAKEMSQYCFQYLNGNRAIFQARLPEVGDYEFTLFAQTATNDARKTYDSVASYIIRCQNLVTDIQVFPKTFSSWVQGYILHEPTRGVLRKTGKTRFSLTAPGVVDMAVCVRGGNGDWLTLSLSNKGIWEGEVEFGSDAEEATVVVKLEGQKSTTFSSILKYSLQE